MLNHIFIVSLVLLFSFHNVCNKPLEVNSLETQTGNETKVDDALVLTKEDLKKLKQRGAATRGLKLNQFNAEETGRYFEGDIILSNHMRNGIFGDNYRWPKGIVPFEIHGDFTSENIATIRQAMDSYHRYTCIRFRPRQENDQNYISITSDELGCYSQVGDQKTGAQEVNFALPDCLFKVGTVMHELMHVLGFWHEQSRHERDKYVNVHFENIKNGRIGNFNKTDNDINFGQPYDFGSLMHYSPNAFSKNGEKTITAKRVEDLYRMGQRRGFSRYDIAKINSMYNCKKKTKKFNLKNNATYAAEKRWW